MISKRLHIIISILLFVISFISNAQNKPTLKFEKDSVLIGELTSVHFSYMHKIEEEVIFADSTYDFTPFEFEKLEVFNTRSTDSTSYDSVVYWLSTFELDKIQVLRLPVYIYSQNDSIPIYSNYDSIRLTELISVMSAFHVVF